MRGTRGGHTFSSHKAFSSDERFVHRAPSSFMMAFGPDAAAGFASESAGAAGCGSFSPPSGCDAAADSTAIDPTSTAANAASCSLARCSLAARWSLARASFVTSSRMLEVKSTYALRAFLGAFGTAVDPGGPEAFRLVGPVVACTGLNAPFGAASTGSMAVRQSVAISPLFLSSVWHNHLRMYGGVAECPLRSTIPTDVLRKSGHGTLYVGTFYASTQNSPTVVVFLQDGDHLTDLDSQPGRIGRRILGFDDDGGRRAQLMLLRGEVSVRPGESLLLAASEEAGAGGRGRSV